ncbi:MAG: ACT domain-containing protein [Acidobacteriota bacterium]
MTNIYLTLSVLDGAFAICRLDAQEPLPEWAMRGDFFSITRAAHEISIVCAQSVVPEGVRCEREWRCLRVEGPLDFSLTGILNSLTAPLAAAGISIFAISTFDTDYLLVKEKDLERTIENLVTAGHIIT